MTAGQGIFAPMALVERPLLVEVVPVGTDVPATAVRGVLLHGSAGGTGSPDGPGDAHGPSSPALDDPALTPDRLARLGLTGEPGRSVVLTSATGPLTVVTVARGLSTDELRDAAAAVSLAAPREAHLRLDVPDGVPDPAAAAHALVEGAALARYSYRLGAPADEVPLARLTVGAADAVRDEVEAGAARGRVVVAACELGRDLANCPGSMLTAARLAEIAEELAPGAGLDVEVVDEDGLRELGCGGLLAVNLGSTDPPRMVRLTYRPAHGSPTGRLTLVGKGITYDSGGIALKPGDAVHATMKNDMSGAGAILAAMTALAALDCPVQVTGLLMCTDNMPSGSALKLGDVLTTRGGRTVEVVNSDAEGRLVMADALVLATEEPTDAVVDVATLTGACLRALGAEVAGVLGTDQPLVDQLRRAAERTDEPVWQLPLHRSYRRELDSPIADLRNLGGPNAGAITAALFLAEFVGDVPWAHVDIAGTAQADTRRGWRNRGATGFGTRLLIDFATTFVAPR